MGKSWPSKIVVVVTGLALCTAGFVAHSHFPKKKMSRSLASVRPELSPMQPFLKLEKLVALQTRLRERKSLYKSLPTEEAINFVRSQSGSFDLSSFTLPPEEQNKSADEIYADAVTLKNKIRNSTDITPELLDPIVTAFLQFQRLNEEIEDSRNQAVEKEGRKEARNKIREALLEARKLFLGKNIADGLTHLELGKNLESEKINLF